MKVYKTALLHKELLGKKYLYLTFKRPKDFNFLSGQFISIIISETVKRSYSLASPDFIKDTFSLLVDISPQGVGTKYLNSLKIGDNLSFIGPFGTMTLPSNLSDFSYFNFISTGSGIAPFLSLIPSLVKRVPAQKVFLLHSFKEDTNFFRHPVYDLVNTKIVFTKKAPPNYELGRVTKHTDFLKTQNSLNYLCGIKDMILELKSTLEDSAKGVKFEIFY